MIRFFYGLHTAQMEIYPKFAYSKSYKLNNNDHFAPQSKLYKVTCDSFDRMIDQYSTCMYNITSKKKIFMFSAWNIYAGSFYVTNQI